MRLIDILFRRNKRKINLSEVSLREISIEQASSFSEIQTIHNIISYAAARMTASVSILNVENKILSENLDKNFPTLLADYIVFSLAITDNFLNYHPVFGADIDEKKHILVDNPRKTLLNAQTLLNKLYHLNRLEINYLNISRASVILKNKNTNYVPTQSEIEELKRAFENKMRSAEASFFITSSDFDFSYPQLLEHIDKIIFYRQQVVRELCALFNLDAQFFNDSEHKTYNNKFEALRSLYTNLIIPSAYEFLHKLNEHDSMNHFSFSLNINEIELLSVYKAEQSDYVIKLLQNGIIDVKEARGMLGLD